MTVFLNDLLHLHGTTTRAQRTLRAAQIHNTLHNASASSPALSYRPGRTTCALTFAPAFVSPTPYHIKSLGHYLTFPSFLNKTKMSSLDDGLRAKRRSANAAAEMPPAAAVASSLQFLAEHRLSVKQLRYGPCRGGVCRSVDDAPSDDFDFGGHEVEQPSSSSSCDTADGLCTLESSAMSTTTTTMTSTMETATLEGQERYTAELDETSGETFSETSGETSGETSSSTVVVCDSQTNTTTHTATNTATYTTAVHRSGRGSSGGLFLAAAVAALAVTLAKHPHRAAAAVRSKARGLPAKARRAQVNIARGFVVARERTTRLVRRVATRAESRHVYIVDKSEACKVEDTGTPPYASYLSSELYSYVSPPTRTPYHRDGGIGVGRRTLTPSDPQLKGAWYPGGFNPAPIKWKTRFQNVQVQRAPLHRGG
jgi:hypothetical protein